MTIKLGSKGEEVKVLQRYLNLYVDGCFGRLTDEALREWQMQHGLKPDGVCGARTWKALKECYECAKQAQGEALKKVGGRYALYKTKRRVREIIVHCTATPDGMDATVQTIKSWHKAQGWSDIGYHYVVYRDGSVHVGRDVDVAGAHCSGHNTGSIGVVYVGGTERGNMAKAKDTRTQAQRDALQLLVMQLMDLYDLPLRSVKGHCEYANKACPSFDMKAFRESLHE